MLGKIYKITNLINGKVYIGQTIQSLRDRWYRHVGNAKSISENERNMVIKKAIFKYGKENFSMTLLEECNTFDLDKREIHYISYYDSFNKGYNSTRGGQANKATSVLKLENVASDIAELYQSGFSLREIGKEFNVDKHTIKSILERNNIKIKTTRSYKYSQKERQSIVRDFNNGISRKDIIDKYKISRSYLSQLLNNKRRI